MTHREFENYLALIGQMLKLRREDRDAIGCELRDHLELRVADLVEEGVDENEATRMALMEFGDATVLAGQFQMISKSYQRRWIMRFATFSVIGSFVAALLLMSLWPQNNRFGSPEMAVAQETSVQQESAIPRAVSSIPITGKKASIASLENKKILDFLKQDISMDFEEEPFSNVLEWMREHGKVNVILDQTANDDLAPDTLVTIRISELRVENALRLMLREHNATIVPRDGVLRIISLDVASDPEFFVRRIYDVRDLLDKINETNSLQSTAANIKDTRKEILAEQELISLLLKAFDSDDPKQMQKMLEASDSSVVPSEQTAPIQEQKMKLRALIARKRARVSQLSRTTNFSAHQELIDVIKTSIAPDDWDDTNGDGTCQVLAGLLIVHQSQDVQSGIESLLNDVAHAIFNE